MTDTNGSSWRPRGGAGGHARRARTAAPRADFPAGAGGTPARPAGDDPEGQARRYRRRDARRRRRDRAVRRGRGARRGHPRAGPGAAGVGQRADRRGCAARWSRPCSPGWDASGSSRPCRRFHSRPRPASRPTSKRSRKGCSDDREQAGQGSRQQAGEGPARTARRPRGRTYRTTRRNSPRTSSRPGRRSGRPLRRSPQAGSEGCSSGRQGESGRQAAMKGRVSATTGEVASKVTGQGRDRGAAGARHRGEGGAQRGPAAGATGRGSGRGGAAGRGLDRMGDEAAMKKLHYRPQADRG